MNDPTITNSSSQPIPTTPFSSPSAPSDHDIQELLNQRNFAEVEKCVRVRLTQEPNNADLRYFLGTMYYFQGQVGQSVENLKKALALNPRHTDAAVCLSVLFNDIGKYDEAKKVFEQANQSVSHQPFNADPEIDRKFSVKHLEMADLYFRYRRYDEAIEEYSKAARLDPHDLDIRIKKAKTYAKKGFLTRAMQELQQLKKEQSEYMPARIQLGLLHYSQGNILDAELEWETVIELQPTHREARAYLQMAKKNRGN